MNPELLGTIYVLGGFVLLVVISRKRIKNHFKSLKQIPRELRL